MIIKATHKYLKTVAVAKFSTLGAKPKVVGEAFESLKNKLARELGCIREDMLLEIIEEDESK